MNQGFLVLESGETYPCNWLGGKNRAGEVVFNTSHAGYQEIATDPSYFGQIMVMTAPMIGNYGVSENYLESTKPYIEGLIVLEMTKSQAQSDFLKTLLIQNIPVVEGLNTRGLTLHLRNSGTQWGALIKADHIDTAKSQAFELIAEVKKGETDWVSIVSRKKVQEYQGEKAKGLRVAVLDYGCKNNIIRELQKRNALVQVFPCKSTAEDVLKFKPNGVLLSNGPGDPAMVKDCVQTIQDLYGKVPIFGICMGHQLLALARGAKTYKLKFGHRGANHPVQDLVDQQISITSQNHGYTVDPDTLPSDLKMTHINLNDQTLEGFASESSFAMSVQFHPESHPGPNDASYLFDRFQNMMERFL